VRYYLHRWPSLRSMKRARARVKALTGRSQVGMELKAVIERLNLFLRGWGNYFRTGNAANKFVSLDRRLVPRPGPVQVDGHYPLPKGSVTMSRRPSVSRMPENGTYGLKGGWGTGPAMAPRP
jgi:hypothetical protein